MENVASNNPLKPVIRVDSFSAFYGKKVGVHSVTFPIYKHKITAIIGPSGCGKSTLLRNMNRMNDNILNYKTSGDIYFEEKNIFNRDTDLMLLRKKIGMVFQRPTPFPMSVFDNVAFGVRLHHRHSKETLSGIVEESLKKASLWSEVKDELHKPAESFSGGQQQRMCIARALAVEPEVILLDEPTSALDPIATKNIEILLEALEESYSIVIVTHNLSQAIRISDYMAFMYRGELVEYGETSEIVKQPKNPLTEEYLSGKIS